GAELRAAGPGDRPRRDGVDGAEEARRILLRCYVVGYVTERESEEMPILIRCWIADTRLREFVEVVVRATIYSPPDPRHRPCPSAVQLDGHRLEESCWENIQAIIERTSSDNRAWLGVWWECREYQYDEAERHLFPWEKSGTV